MPLRKIVLCEKCFYLFTHNKNEKIMIIAYGSIACCSSYGSLQQQ